MRDFSEFRQHWRPLAASIIGMGSALSLNTYVLSTFAPYLIEDFGWSRSLWALLGLPQFLVMVFIPLAGRLADRYGVRRIAAVGAAAYPLSLLAIAMMNGDPAVYLAINIAQVIVCSSTTATIYSRLAAENFTVWRGLALAVCGSGPALIAMIGSPAITAFTEAHGWRAGYVVVALFSALCGLVTFALMPRTSQHPTAQKADAAPPPTRAVYRAILRRPLFWTLLAGTFLVNLPHALASSQLKLLVMEQGASATTAAMLISVFAIGVTIGRLLSGLALDYFPAHIVAAVGLGLPLPGLLLMASSHDATAVLVVAILCMGLSFGSEGDVIAYLVVRHFGIGVYGTVLGLLTAAMGAAMATGTLLLGVILKQAGSFDPYLLIASGTVFVGSLLFLSIGARRTDGAARPAPG